MFEELAWTSVIASSMTLQHVGNDLAHFIILLQNYDSAKHTGCGLLLHANSMSIKSKLNPAITVSHGKCSYSGVGG